MKSRVLLSLVALLSASVSFASFELMVACDANGKLHRYDIENSVYMGAASNFRISVATAFTLNQANSTAYVADFSNRIHRINYFTNEYLGSFASGVFDIKHMSMGIDGSLITTHSTGTRVFNQNSGASIRNLSYVAGDVAVGAVQKSDGTYAAVSYIGGGASYYRNSFNASGAMVLSSFIDSGSSNLSYTTVGLYGNNDVITYGRSLLTGFRSVFSLSGSALTPTTLSSTISGADVLATTGGRLHDGTYMTAAHRISSGNTLVTGYYTQPGTGQFLGTPTSLFTISGTTSLVGVNVVTAPEPASMIALGLGLAAVMKRRKGKK
jgi:hypothetical protein